MRKVFCLLVISSLCYGGIIGKPKAAEFLLINFDAESLGCGGAGVAGKGLSKLCLNPSSIIGVKGEEVVFFHSEWISDLSYEFFGYAKELRGCAISLSGGWLRMPKIKGRGPDKESLEYSASDLLLALSYAKETKVGVLGGSVKLIELKIEEERGDGMAIDIGWLLERDLAHTESKYWYRLGISISNVGPEIQFVAQSDPLPLTLRAGFAFGGRSRALLFDLKKEVGEPFTFHLGGEQRLADMLSLMAGGYTDFKSGCLSFGFEMRYRSLTLDYAYLPYDKALGGTHHISLSLIHI